MKRNRLGRSGIVVSDICMGTMTFGHQADERTSFRIMDMAYDAGVDFYDTAGMYPVPPDQKYAGATEEIVGRWLKTKDRDSVILATKVAGPSHVWIKAPLAGGVLSGKYNDGRLPEGARFSMYQQGEKRQRVMARRFVNDRALESTRRYGKIAGDLGMSPVTLAVAWSKQHDFVASTIVEATSPEQMPDILAAADVTLSAETLARIDAVSREILYPMG